MLNGWYSGNLTIFGFFEKLSKDISVPFSPVSKVPEFLVEWRTLFVKLLPQCGILRVESLKSFWVGD